MTFWRALTLLLTAICAPLASLAEAGDVSRSAVELNPLSKLDPASFQSFVQRPLFSPDRRAPQNQLDDDKASAPEPVDTFDIKLLGITVTPEGATARIKDNSDGTLHSLNVGDVFNEWHVDSIAANTVAMSKDSNKRIYDLFAKASVFANDTRAVTDASSTKSTDGDCGDTGGSNCDEKMRHQQDLIDFFGTKAK